MPDFKLTNQMVAERSQALFASSKSTYNFPNANRFASRLQLEAHIKTHQPQVAYISDFQGAGKSTLMEMVVNTFQFPSDRSMVRVRDVTTARLDEDAKDFGTLFVDDADIRTTWKRITDGLRAVRDYGVTNRCPIVVCGDYTIRGDELRSIFDPLPQLDVVMEPVDRKFLLEALNYRLRYLFKQDESTIPDDINLVFDDDLLACLVPDSSVPVATFREVLTLAEGISYEIEPDGNEFRLRREHAERFCRSHPLDGPTPEQWRFLSGWLRPFVTEVYPRGRGMKPFGAEDVFAALSIPGVDNVDKLVATVLGPLCSGGVLHALGVPRSREGQFDRYPGPYLPRPTFLLQAYAGDNWQRSEL